MAIQPLDGNGLPHRPDKVEPGRTARRDDAVRGAEAGDRIQLSPEVREIAGLAETARQLPDVREERVEALRRELAAGTYKVEPRQLARAILDAEDELDH